MVSELFFAVFLVSVLIVASAIVYWSDNRHISPTIFLFVLFTALISGSIAYFSDDLMLTLLDSLNIPLYYFDESIFPLETTPYIILCFIIMHIVLRFFFHCTKWLATIIFGLLACSIPGILGMLLVGLVWILITLGGGC